MTEWLLVIGVILVLLGLVAYRYRRHIQTAWIMWQTFSKFRRQMKPAQKRVEKKSASKDEPLVRCPKCNKWVTQDDAVKLKSNYYCSLACMEEAISFKK